MVQQDEQNQTSKTKLYLHIESLNENRRMGDPDDRSTKTLTMRTILNLIFVVPCIMLYIGEISPTRCNNCVFYSQWLYSTCFG